MTQIRKLITLRTAISALFPLMLALLFVSDLRADTLSGIIKDPSGTVVASAEVEISGPTLLQPLLLKSDESGKFAAPQLAPGKYVIHVNKEGFQENVSNVDLHGTATLEIRLVIAEQRTSVSVSDKSIAFANSDPLYRELRDVGLGVTYFCENVKFTVDVGTFELKSGTLTFLKPVDRFITGAVFVGEGHFTLKPVLHSDEQEITRRAASATAEEDFHEVVFRFIGSFYPQLVANISKTVETPAEAATVVQHWRERLRYRHEVPEGFTQDVLESETIDNIDADILASIYNPKHPAFFNAYMAGKPHKDLRFFVRLRTGAVPQLDSPEEVALINCNGGSDDDGFWYSQHIVPELKALTASSEEDKRLFATRRYKIETVIGKNNHFFSRATVTFEPLVDGERVLKFGLLPMLRVSRVTDENGRDLHFIQEGRKEDGSFYAILDQPPELGKEHSISVEYVGDKVLYDAGGGSYYVGARESWYPNLNGFGEKALYDLTFKVPKSNVVISVGKLEAQSTEEGFDVSHWVTPVPVAVAGFNYGRYTKMDFPDPQTHYAISGYYLTELPDNLARFRDGPLGSMAPSSMTKYVLAQTRAQLQLCTYYFGKAPYDNFAITEQPNFNFGQSWPNLVYLPISAYIDSTQRWMLFGHIDSNFSGFVQEVTPHEVAHQWFGHSVTWASYHDLWLSEGFADFAAGLFLQQAMGEKWQKDYLDYWERQRQRILGKNNYGVSPNDAGPLWLGLRLISPKSRQAYQGVTYSKGGYILLMLRSMMYDDDATSGDKDHRFIEMMHDFITSHHDKPASTESFKAIVEKYMTPGMDLQKNGRLDWFFDEWIYGTHVPRYAFKYEVLPAEAGQVKVRTEITQSEVDDRFAMFVPLYGDFGKGLVRIGQVPIVGNSTRNVIVNMHRAPKRLMLNAFKDVLER